GVLDRVVLQLLLVLSGPVRPHLSGDGPGGPALGQAQPARGGGDVRAVLSGQGQEDTQGNIFSPGRCGELAEQDGGGGDIPQASSQRGSGRVLGQQRPVPGGSSAGHRVVGEQMHGGLRDPG